MKISEIIADKYKLLISPIVYYDLLSDVREAEEEQATICPSDKDDCDDAISRAELLKAIDTWDRFGYTETGCFVREPKNDCVKYIHYDDVIECIKGMPSVSSSDFPNKLDDAISRRAVIQHICEEKFCYKENCKGVLFNRCPDITWVNELPSVTPGDNEVIDNIRAELHATAEKHEDGAYYLRDEWIDEIIDKYAKENKS